MAHWDRHAIKAEIYRRGETLKSLGEKHGLVGSDIRVSLHRPFPKADRVVSLFLGYPLHKLWPDRYDTKGNSLSLGRDSAKHSRVASPKAPAAADMGAAQ